MKNSLVWDKNNFVLKINFYKQINMLNNFLKKFNSKIYIIDYRDL